MALEVMENKSEIYITRHFKVKWSLEFHVLWERNWDQLYLREEMGKKRNDSEPYFCK